MIKKKFIGVLFSTLLLVLFTSCGSSSKAIKIVKDGYIDAYPSVSVAEGADRLFKKASYDAFDGRDGYYYVDISGKLNISDLSDNLVKCLVEFGADEAEAEGVINEFTEAFKDFDVVIQMQVDVAWNEFGFNNVLINNAEVTFEEQMFWLDLLLTDDYTTVIQNIFILQGM